MKYESCKIRQVEVEVSEKEDLGMVFGIRLNMDNVPRTKNAVKSTLYNI